MKTRFDNLPLIWRFMIAPLIGATVIVVLAIFVWNYRENQAEQSSKMQTEVLDRTKRIVRLSNQFSASHSAVFQLLVKAPLQTDEGAYYQEARPILNQLFDLESRLRTELETSSESAEINSQLEVLSEAVGKYRLSAGNALMMATVDFALAEGLIVENTNNFSTVIKQFLTLEQSLQSLLDRRLEAYNAELSDATTQLELIFAGTIAFMLLVSILLSRVLSRDLRSAITALSALTHKKEGPPPDTIQGGETAILAKAIDGARENHEILLKTSGELREANTRLRSSHEAVEARERSLAALNAELSKNISELNTTILERDQAEHALRNSEHQLRAIFENNTESLILIDDSGIITAFNKATEEMFGYQAEEILGQNVSMLMPDPDRSRHDRYMRAYMETGEAKIIGIGRELTAMRKSGEEFAIRLGIGEIREGGKSLFVGNVTDLTEIKSLEKQLRRSQKMEAIGELTGGIAHDFNNLLGIIVGNLTLVKRLVAENEKVSNRIQKAEDAALRGANLTQRLLNFSRQNLDASSPIDINPVIESLRELIGKSLTSRISLELELADDLWLTEVDPSAFEDVLINLTLNARDAMPDGGRLIIETRNTYLDHTSAIGTVEGGEEGDFVEISVTDTGIGMSAEIQERVFDPFFSTKDTGKGTGLGLSMAYGFIKRSKGQISVYSEEGRGTTFRLFLPRSAGQAAELTKSSTADVDIPRGQETVLVVDDEEALLSIADEVLQSLGYTTLCAQNGDEAMTILRQDHAIDLLFSDVIMPGPLNGFNLAEAARELRPGLKVLLASGFTGKALNTEGDADLVRNMLAKPYRDIDLAQRVREVLDVGE